MLSPGSEVTFELIGAAYDILGEDCDHATLFEEAIQVVGGTAMELEWSGAGLLSADASPAGDGTEFQVGDCINGAIGWNRSNTDVVPCTAPHTYQIVGKVAYVTADDTFPGRDALLQLGDEECDAAFEGFVGIAYDDSIWHMSIWVPTSGTWEAGDRDVVRNAARAKARDQEFAHLDRVIDQLIVAGCGIGAEAPGRGSVAPHRRGDAPVAVTRAALSTAPGRQNLDVAAVVLPAERP